MAKRRKPKVLIHKGNMPESVVPETILQEAQRITGGSRRSDYGHPLENHQTTADLVTSYLRGKYQTPFTFIPQLTAEDVCFFNVLQKVSREATGGEKRDTLVDIAGYARNVEMIRDKRALKNQSLK